MRLLPILFIFTGVMTFIDRSYNTELLKLSAIRSTMADAVTESRSRLVHTTWATLQDNQFAQNLDMGNVNTISQTLQGVLRPGEVTQMEVLDAECQLMVRAPQSSKPISDICRHIKTGRPSVDWQITDSGEPVLVSLTAREISGRKIFLASQLVFDHSWVTVHPQLAKYASQRMISWDGQGRGSNLWKDGRLADGRHAITLKVDGWLYRMIPDLTGIALVPMRESFWVLYGALGIVMMISILQVSASGRQDERRRQALKSWISECPGHSLEAEKDYDWQGLLGAAKCLLVARDEQQLQQTKLLRERVEHLTLRVRERESEVAHLEDKVSSMSDLASLQEQIQHTTAAFMRQIDQMRESCETISDVISAGLAEQARSLNTILERWKSGITQGSNRELAARKFFRSLVEAQGSRPGWSKLDDDMRSLLAISSLTLDQSLHASMLSKQVMQDCEIAGKLAGLWHGISMRDRAVKTCEWVQCLTAAQSLVQADSRFSALTFETLPQIVQPEEMYPLVGHGALVSGFFHLYLALLSDADVSTINLPVVVRQKRFKDQATLILSLPAKKGGAEVSSPSRQMFYHTDLAKQILAAQGLKVSILPPTIAGYPVGLTWTVPQSSVTIENDQCAVLSSKSSGVKGVGEVTV
jgi:hypothetical protein